MSFILDALKKSESDRQQHSTPGIASVPIGRSAGGAPRWLPIVIVLLAVNLAAVLFLLLRPSSGPSAAAKGPAALPVAEVPAPPAGNASGAALAAVDTSTATTSPAGAEPRELPAAVTATTETPSPEARAEPERAIVKGRPEGKTAATTAEQDYVDAGYLTLNDLRASGAMNLPELHIDLHVYSDNPGERFVFINMSQYRENSTLEDGPLLRRITPEGALLEYRGSTFLLPRD